MEYEIICDSLDADVFVYRATDFEITPDGCVLYNENTGSVIVVENVMDLTIIPYKG